MIIDKITRDQLLDLAQKKKIYLEGNILKVISEPDRDTEFADYLKVSKEKDTTSRRKRLEVTKQVQSQNKELTKLNEENVRINQELKESLYKTEEARKNAESSKEIAEELRKEAEQAKWEAEKLRDGALEDLDSLQKRTQFELMGKIVKVALWVILGVGVCTTILFAYVLITGAESAIVESTWSNMFGILLTNSFSIIGTIMGVKYAGKEK